MVRMNIFRILGDVSHTVSICILIWAIHSNKSAEGVSLLTQFFYMLVFVARYIDLFWIPPTVSWWNFTLKIFYIWSSTYIIFLMMRVYARTREREKAWKLGAYALGGSAVLAPLVSLVFNGWSRSTFVEVLWTFSIILESVCVLPQLLLLRQTTVPTVIDSFYLLTLGSYRAFYILNWVVRAFSASKPDPISVIFGIVQTAFYADFAWVYWTRQRVKLRGGAIIDADDLRKGWLVNKVIAPGAHSTEDDEEAAPADGNTNGQTTAPKVNRWGARGVSVSADDTLHDHDRNRKGKAVDRSPTEAESAKADEDEDADIFASDDDEDVPQLDEPGQKVLNSGRAWQVDDDSK